MKILDGQKIAADITNKLSDEVVKLKTQGVNPALHIFLIGENPASLAYVGVKQKKAAEIGVECIVRKYEPDIAYEKVIDGINQDNLDPDCHGIIVQLPLPEKFDPNKLLQVIDVNKDVDGLTYLNQWRLMYGQPGGFLPATAKGIMTMLDYYQIPIEGKKVVVVGRSRLVGLPVSLLMLRRNATVTICHSYTPDLASQTSQADILVVAAGKPGLIKKEFIKEKCAVIDVGISRTETDLKGDVDFANVKNSVQAITPVPGGVGPMTVVSLFENLLESAAKVLTNQQ